MSKFKSSPWRVKKLVLKRYMWHIASSEPSKNGVGPFQFHLLIGSGTGVRERLGSAYDVRQLLSGRTISPCVLMPSNSANTVWVVYSESTVLVHVSILWCRISYIIL